MQALLAAWLEKVWTRDGLWAVIALGLMGCLGYLYFGEIRVIRRQLDDVIFNQTRECIRRLGPKVDPVAACMTPVPR